MLSQRRGLKLAKTPGHLEAAADGGSTRRRLNSRSRDSSDDDIRERRVPGGDCGRARRRGQRGRGRPDGSLTGRHSLSVASLTVPTAGVCWPLPAAGGARPCGGPTSAPQGWGRVLPRGAETPAAWRTASVPRATGRRASWTASGPPRTPTLSRNRPGCATRPNGPTTRDPSETPATSRLAHVFPTRCRASRLHEIPLRT